MQSAQVKYLSEFNRNAVYRASSLFWVKENSRVETSIEFLNYWLIKRNIPEVGLTLKLRDLKGNLISGKEVLINEPKGYSIKIRDLLKEVNWAVDFEGSIDLEFYSSRPMGFAVPAILCLYKGNDWQSFIHSYVRTYSQASGDKTDDICNLKTAEESNLTIRENENVESVIIIHNGPFHLESFNFQIEVFNYEGKSQIIQIPIDKALPFETFSLKLCDFTNLKTFLADQLAWISVKFPVKGIFPRIMAADLRKSDGAVLSVAHSHHNSANSTEYLEYTGNNIPEKLMFISLPSSDELPWVTNLYCYRTYPEDVFYIREAHFSKLGEILSSKVSPMVAELDFNRKKLLKLNSGKTPDDSEIIDFTLIPKHNKIPARIHLAVEFMVPNNISTCIFTTGFAPFIKPRYSTYWFPILNMTDRDDYFVFINTDLSSEYNTEIDASVIIFRNQDSEMIKSELRLSANTGKATKLENFIPNIKQFLSGTSGWCYLKMHKPVNAHLYYACIHNISKWISADHGF